ncbi:MAG: ribosome biogenesis GTPase Der, partial [Deltaproteobacteria bacterium]|nr:ribosome biogenesis GTPase Der [Deltaproteobacteria bacterium]
SITLDVAGVTRDRHYAPASWNGKEFVCVDTGGFPSELKGSLERQVSEQIELAIHEAEVILFVVDGRSGLLPEEKEIGQHLRMSGKTVFVVVSKIDGPVHEGRQADFYSLSKDPMPVSGEHGYGVADLLDRVVEKFPLSETTTEKPESGPICIAILGRPNVGKSSLLNELLGENRVVVHEMPGTTRDATLTPITRGSQEYLFLDTAGIRRKGKHASQLERFSVLRALSAIERSDICLAVLDATEGIHRQDAHVVGYACEAQKGIILIWNKTDLVSKKKEMRHGLSTQVREKFKFLSYAPITFVSAKTGEGVEGLWPMINRLHQTMAKKIKTSDLNRLLEELVLTQNLPVFKGKPVKFYYGTQTRTCPPQFAFFTNEPKGVHFSFARYLVNRIREAFGFGGSPIQILFRKK